MKTAKINGVWVLLEPLPKRGAAVSSEPKSEAWKTCPHRSEAFTLHECKSCRGSVQIKVHDCLHFGAKCTATGRMVDGLTTLACATCGVPRDGT